MTNVILIAALLSATFGVTAPCGQRNDDSLTVHVCNIILQIPTNLKRNSVEGVDSCVAEFENGDMLLVIDYGFYGDDAKKSDVTLDFKKQSFSIARKTGRFAKYIDDSLYARKHPERKYVAHLYVVVRRLSNPPITTSLTIIIRGRSVNELEIGRRVLRSVRFDIPHPRSQISDLRSQIVRIRNQDR